MSKDTYVFPNGGQWETVITRRSNGAYDTVIRSKMEKDGRQLWYEVTTERGPYPEPLIVEEPGLGFPARDFGFDHDCRVVGFVVVEAGRVTGRFSLSHAIYSNGMTVEAAPGALVVNGKELYIAALVYSNRRRIDGTIAVCTRTPPQGSIPLLEAVDDLFPYALCI